MIIAEMKRSLEIFDEYGHGVLGVGHEIIWVSVVGSRYSALKPSDLNKADIMELDQMGWWWNDLEEYWQNFA